jgi:Zn-dependent M28 family amino/carboxypeptidase
MSGGATLLIGVATSLVAAFAALVWYMIGVPGRAHRGPLPPLTAEETDLARRLLPHIVAVASRPHNVRHYAELEKSARYIEQQLAALGYASVAQVYRVDGRNVRNIEATIEPTDAAHSPGSLVIGAHYDSAGDAPGANDNGSGVAALIELARLLADLRGKSVARIRLVFFVNEEPPYSHGPDMGSYRYAKALAERGERVLGMISLETLGCFFDAPGTQRYPFPFGLIYPTEGNFIAFVGLMSPRSRKFLHKVVRSFRRHTAFPTIGGVAPAIIPGMSWSDHWSFEQFGFPALMITDTAPFRYPHYHRVTDTPDKVDVESLARITRGLERVARELASP